ncbi:hypothetical protein L6252_02930 [Candidatus Parcubacteria bacterium]|nr:hypothetical protein [Candidatus Parcubacteria bacterium]
MNEIKIECKKQVYFLTNQNNLRKYDRAKKNIEEAGDKATPCRLLAYYDGLSGRIEDEKHNPIITGQFWKEEQKRKKSRQKRKEKIGKIIKYLKGFIVYIVLPLVVTYLVYKFRWNK